MIISKFRKDSPDNFYIKVLKFGNKYSNGFGYSELFREVKLSDDERTVIETFFRNAFNVGKYHPILGGSRTDPQMISEPELDTVFVCLVKGTIAEDVQSKYILKYDAYFNYLNYEDLKNTKLISKIALGLSITTLMISILLSYIQINISKEQLIISYKQFRSPTEIKQGQIQSIQKSVYSVKCIKN